jgi:hypothetical protein
MVDLFQEVYAMVGITDMGRNTPSKGESVWFTH